MNKKKFIKFLDLLDTKQLYHLLDCYEDIEPTDLNELLSYEDDRLRLIISNYIIKT